MTMTTTTKARTLIKALLARGFRRGAPDRIPEVTRQLERTFFATHMDCASCSHRGMRWHPFHKGRTYKAVWECPACGAGHEKYRPIWADPAVDVARLFAPRRQPA